jgi:RNA polymerase sigma-70 factor, ECF subfamily
MPVSEDFARLTDPLRPELLAHCYRMLGSVQDAEDQVQETLARAWRSYGDFEGRASLRTWLHRIATNTCLRALENNSRRALPSGLGAPSEYPEGPLPDMGREVRWLQPMPDGLVSPWSGDPAAIVESRQNIRLSLIAALQYLPGRQRAVLILRDVLGWRAAEVADLLGTTTTAVNGMLARARTRLAEVAPDQEHIHEPASPGDRALVDKYATAFANSDVTTLVRLMREDAVFEMPPRTVWFAGRATIGRFLRSWVLTEPGRFLMIPVAANGQPAFGCYMRESDGSYSAYGIQVLTLSGPQVARVTTFSDPGLLATFELPKALPAGALAGGTLDQ